MFFMDIFDPGSVSLAFQVIILFLLIIGLPFVRGKAARLTLKGTATLL